MQTTNLQTKEPQYNLVFDVIEKHGIAKLGLMINESWNQDPKRTLFTLARYKFVAKMLAEQNSVLEIGCFDAIYSLDVLEHINPDSEHTFMENALSSLKKTGVMIVGMPSLESQAYASPQSKIGHVNCKSGNDLKALMQRYFDNVFLFSMNDEVVHTGFYPMAHYLLGLGCGKR